MSAVGLKGVWKSFGANAIVKGVDLDVAPGEFLVLVGPSGCGKSTLLRLIAGLESADQGEITFEGRRVNDLAPRDRDVGMVFQSYALYPHMTVRENLAFGLTLRGLPTAEIEARVAEAAQMLELGTLLARRPKELSGGQRQRVAMGRAICRRPKLFLFDEPLSNLDTALRVQMRGELSTLHRRLNTTMIYVTHDQVEAMTLATRVAVFNAGALQQVGPPLELYHRPANRFVATFLGSPSMNIFAAARVGDRLRGQGFELEAPAPVTVSGDLLVGLRPQELLVGDSGPWRGTVRSVERLGFDGFAYLDTEAGPLAARFQGDLAVGSSVRVRPTQDAVHLFTADGAQALHHPSAPQALSTPAAAQRAS